MDRLQEKYVKEVVPALTEQFGYKNVMELPKVEKVIISMGVGEAAHNSKALDSAVADLTIIAGQKPVLTRAKNLLQHGNCVQECLSVQKLLFAELVCISSLINL